MLIPVCVMLNLLASMRVSPLHFALLATVACSDSSGLPDPTFANEERTETLYALTGTPVGTPSAYAIHGSQRVRTDISQDFDFAFGINGSDGGPVFVPRAVLGIEPNATLQPGLMPSSLTFEGITEAPSNGYITDQVVPIAVGDRFLVRGRITCDIGVSKYAKLEVVAIEASTRTVTFRVLTNQNCGYKGLRPGVPDV
jgi:hypothetical protein